MAINPYCAEMSAVTPVVLHFCRIHVTNSSHQQKEILKHLAVIVYPLFFKGKLVAKSVVTSRLIGSMDYLPSSGYDAGIDLEDNPPALNLIYCEVRILRKYHSIIS